MLVLIDVGLPPDDMDVERCKSDVDWVSVPELWDIFEPDPIVALEEFVVVDDENVLERCFVDDERELVDD